VKPAPRFEHTCNALPRDLASLLRKDTVSELVGAWKFHARLGPGGRMLVFQPGYSALALSLARHVAGVDVIGPTPVEQALIAEVAQAKGVSNLRLLDSIDGLRPPYTAIVLMPGRRPSRDGLLQDLVERLEAGQDGREEWWVATCDAVAGIAGRARHFRAVRRARRALTAVSPRLLCAPGTIARSSELRRVADGRLPPLQDRLTLVPSLAGPKQVARGTTGGEPAMPASPAASRGAPCAWQRFSSVSAPSFLDRLMGEVNRHRAFPWKGEGPYRVMPGGKAQVILTCDDPAAPARALLKLPLTPHAAARARLNAEHLERLADAPGLADRERSVLPRSLCAGTCEGQEYFVESFLDGRSAERGSTGRSLAAAEAVVDFWLGIQDRFVRTVTLSDELFRHVFVEPLERVQAWLGPGAAEREVLARVQEYWRRTFLGRQLGLGLVHGDLSPGNVLIDPDSGEVRGVVDWDLADFRSIPPIDVLNFLVRLDPLSFRQDKAVIAFGLVRGVGDGGPALPLRGAERHGYRAEDWPAIVMYYWMYCLLGFLGSSRAADVRFRRRRIAEPLALFEQEVLCPAPGSRR
jgi:hypothetical protein